MTTTILSQVWCASLAGAALAMTVRRRASAGPAQFIIVNLNAPGVGFNDPTPAAAGRRQYRHDARPAASDRVRACGQHLERAAGQQRADPHSRAVHLARRRRSRQRRSDQRRSRDFPNAPLAGPGITSRSPTSSRASTSRPDRTTSTRTSAPTSTSTSASTTTTARRTIS